MIGGLPVCEFISESERWADLSVRKKKIVVARVCESG